MKSIVFFIIFLIPSLCYPQSIKYEVGAYGLLSPDSEVMPHWLIFNRNGIFDGNRNEFLTYLDINYENTWGKKWKIEAGIQGINKYPVSASVLQEAYINLSYGKFKLIAGQQEMSLLDDHHTLSSGSFLFSQNARPVPKIGLGFYEYVDVPFTQGYVQVRGFINQGILNDDRSPRGTDKPLLHEKSAYIRSNKLIVNPYFGINHSALFGGTRPDGTKIPVDYLSTVFFRGSQKVGEEFPGEGTNAAGAHQGMFDFGLYFDVKDIHVRFFYQKPVKDGSGYIGIFRKNKDVITGVSLKNINSRLIREFLFERVKTDWQSGPGVHDPIFYGNDWYYRTITDYEGFLQEYYGIDAPGVTKDEFWRMIRRMDNYGYEYGGRDNYYNNGLYYKGWSHHNYAMGNSFLLTKDRIHQFNPDFDGSFDYYFANTRVRAYHFGVSGKFHSNLDYRIKFSIVENLGTYFGLNRGAVNWDSMDPFSDYQYYFSNPQYVDKGLDQYYSMLETVYTLPKKPELKINLSLGIDTKDLYDNYGFLLGVSYSGEVKKKKNFPETSLVHN